MNTNSAFSVTYLASNSDTFGNLLERASSYFDIFDGMDFWIPAKESSLHDMLIEYVRLDVAARAFAEENFEWDDSQLNERWSFYPCGFLLDYCDDIQVSYPDFSDEEFADKLQTFASSSAYDPWDDL
jgi:hypothetical protein